MKKLNKFTIILMALMLTCVIAITASFSWLARPYGDPIDSVSTLQLKDASAVIKSSENCEAKTYVLEKDSSKNGAFKQGDEVATTDSFPISANGVQYFRTVIHNGNTVANNVSLVNLSLGGTTTGLTVNCLAPLKTQSQYKSGMILAQHVTVAGNSDLNVDWYVYNGSSSTISISFTNLPEISYYS